MRPAPSSSSSAADSSSVTAGGVWLIASAYSITRRSSGVNTDASRQRGTSRDLRLVEPVVVRHEVVEVEARSCSRCRRPPPCPRTTRGSRRARPTSRSCGRCPSTSLHHGGVVPEHADRVRHLADHPAGGELHHRTEQAGDLGRGDAGVAGHDVLQCGRATDLVPLTWRHRPARGCDIRVRTDAAAHAVPR